MSTLWPIKPHTAAKHELLRRYLEGWLPVLTRYNERVLYLDGFAGPGEYENGEPGSPLLALRALLDHKHLERAGRDFKVLFLFNEQDPARAAHLEGVLAREEAERSGWPDTIEVRVDRRSFDELADEILDQVSGGSLIPTFAFLDPFGYKGVRLTQVAELLASPRCELFVYFDANSTIRFATSGHVDDALFDLFASDAFKAAPPAGGDGVRLDYLSDLFKQRLESVGEFTHVSRFEMRGENNRVIAHLFHATRHVKGLQLMKDAMWKVDPSGSFSFSDRFAGDSVLFEPEPDTRILQSDLLKHFAGQTVPIEDVRHYVLAQTPFADKHIKRLTLASMRKEGLVSSSHPKGSFPEGTLVTFAKPG